MWIVLFLNINIVTYKEDTVEILFCTTYCTFSKGSLIITVRHFWADKSKRQPQLSRQAWLMSPKIMFIYYWYATELQHYEETFYYLLTIIDW